MRITPNHTSYDPNGPPPVFHVDTGGAPFFAVELASDPYLFNGAAASRRTPLNFFDSWDGDDRAPSSGRAPARRDVAGTHLAAPAGRATYTLPQPVWARLRKSPTLYYRLRVTADERKRPSTGTFADVNWTRAPAVGVVRLPARPVRSPAAAFHGRGVLARPDLLDQAATLLAPRGISHGRDGNCRFVLLDARRFNMTVVECHEWGLTDTIEKMPRKPDAVINGQFITDIVGVGTEGQTIREGVTINADSQPRRRYVAQTWRGVEVSDYHVAEGNPATAEPDARAAFGGLGPVLSRRAVVTPLTPWAQSIYDQPLGKGRGVIAFARSRHIILLLVQEDHVGLLTTNGMTMTQLRDWLLAVGFDDAVFNDGSDSESLFVRGGWLLEPGTAKDESMDFAVGFVSKQGSRRAQALAIDGTKTADGHAFMTGIERPLITHYSPRNLAPDLEALPALASIASSFNAGVLEAWRSTTAAGAARIGDLFELAGSGSHWADVLYLSSHAWRHGQLWYYANDVHTAPKLTIADPWSAGFHPVWRNTPRWLVIAGCAVLGLRYTRGLELDATERAHLVDWHRDIHGAGATVSGLSPAKTAVFPVYHPGWGWYDRVFRSSGLRGVLGYWYRSPARGRDVEIVEAFTTKLREGESFLDAWESTNRGGWLDAQALWAGMVRQGCEGDTLATLEDPALPVPRTEFKYFDRFQRGATVPAAYRTANRLDETTTIGGVTLRHNSTYDFLAIDELKALPVTLSPANFLQYADGVGPGL